VRLKVEGEGLHIDTRADLLAWRVADALLDYHRQTIMQGTMPATGEPKKPLAVIAWYESINKEIPPHEQRRLDRRKSRFRGYDSGGLANGLRRGKIGGGAGAARRATARIMPPTSRNMMLSQELTERGIDYFSTEGLAAAVIEAETDASIEDAITGDIGRYLEGGA
jgi:hypothetical protein